MGLTHDLLAVVQVLMLSRRGWRDSKAPRYRRAYRRLERLEAYLLRRVTR